MYKNGIIGYAHPLTSRDSLRGRRVLSNLWYLPLFSLILFVSLWIRIHRWQVNDGIRSTECQWSADGQRIPFDEYKWGAKGESLYIVKHIGAGNKKLGL